MKINMYKKGKYWKFSKISNFGTQTFLSFRNSELGETNGQR